MSKARFDTSESPQEHVSRAIDLLNKAQAIIDTLDQPHIGARLQEVIDEVQHISRTDEAA